MFNDTESFTSCGLMIGGIHYSYVLKEGQLIMLKADEEKKGGSCLYKTKQNIVIGVYDSSKDPKKVYTTMEKLGKYLVENSY
ncbi:profilin I [Cavenderia fasciculata]|uniref:Profilin I n=1 Tax=Cavenderia fasciculata TaxID=261658 RepID=F4QBB4_CACFS|nr:profilin I [Cavenderia fasciculata]EGG14886.1 profilin I [Cavenderia fasciculata]|eukprot:XP_004351402.1 profilin I [Cavenderia fasciculata]